MQKVKPRWRLVSYHKRSEEAERQTQTEQFPSQENLKRNPKAGHKPNIVWTRQAI
jgi:hypothetical protein